MANFIKVLSLSLALIPCALFCMNPDRSLVFHLNEEQPQTKPRNKRKKPTGEMTLNFNDFFRPAKVNKTETSNVPQESSESSTDLVIWEYIPPQTNTINDQHAHQVNNQPPQYPIPTQTGNHLVRVKLSDRSTATAKPFLDDVDNEKFNQAKRHFKTARTPKNPYKPFTVIPYIPQQTSSEPKLKNNSSSVNSRLALAYIMENRTNINYLLNNQSSPLTREQ